MSTGPKGCIKPLLVLAAIGFGVATALIVASLMAAAFQPDPPEESRKATRTEEPRSAPTTYTVERGDTLSAIADAYGTTVDELVRLNSLTSADAISVDQVQRIEGWTGRRPPRVKKTRSPPSTPRSTSTAQTYMDCIRAKSPGECQAEMRAWKADLEEIAKPKPPRPARPQPASRRSALRIPGPVQIETHGHTVIDSSLTPSQIGALASAVKLHGYRCDSIHTARKGLFTAKAVWKLRCNGGRYEYTVQDRGGELLVTVE